MQNFVNAIIIRILDMPRRLLL